MVNNYASQIPNVYIVSKNKLPAALSSSQMEISWWPHNKHTYVTNLDSIDKSNTDALASDMMFIS